MIGVVVPTVAGRERALAWSLESLTRTLPAGGYRIVIEHGWPTCGQAWNRGAQRLLEISDPAYISFWADDVVALDGWWRPMVESCDDGAVPCAVVEKPDGSIESAGMSFFQFNTEEPADRQVVEHTLTPFVSRAQWEQIGFVPEELHYCTDLWFSAMLAPAPVEVRARARIVHHEAVAARGAGHDIHVRNRLDRDRFHELVAEHRRVPS